MALVTEYGSGGLKVKLAFHSVARYLGLESCSAASSCVTLSKSLCLSVHKTELRQSLPREVILRGFKEPTYVKRLQSVRDTPEAICYTVRQPTGRGRAAGPGEQGAWPRPRKSVSAEQDTSFGACVTCPLEDQKPVSLSPPRAGDCAPWDTHRGQPASLAFLSGWRLTDARADVGATDVPGSCSAPTPGGSMAVPGSEDTGRRGYAGKWSP